ncbi:hypothetical protein [Blastococcus sp. SYSU D00820]
MTEQRSGTTGGPQDEEGSHASVGGGVEQAGGGRTDAEVGVDEAIGQEPADPA